MSIILFVLIRCEVRRETSSRTIASCAKLVAVLHDTARVRYQRHLNVSTLGCDAATRAGSTSFSLPHCPIQPLPVLCSKGRACSWWRKAQQAGLRCVAITAVIFSGHPHTHTGSAAIRSTVTSLLGHSNPQPATRNPLLTELTHISPYITLRAEIIRHPESQYHVLARLGPDPANPTSILFPVTLSNDVAITSPQMASLIPTPWTRDYTRIA